MFSKKLGVAVLVTVIALVLSVSASVAQDLPSSIRFGTINDPAVDRVNQMLVQNFNTLYPNIEVSVEYITGDLAANYAAQAAAGTLPDVIWLADLFVVPFAQGEIVADMQPLADADAEFDITDVYENLLGLSRVNGEGLYMIPSSYDVVTMYYNITLFEEAGAPLPTPEWSWDDYIAACQTIRSATGKYCFANGGGLPTFDWWAWVVPWIVGYGGDILSEDGSTVLLSSPETIAGLQAYVNLWTEYDIAQPLDFDAGGNCFIVGECATMFFIPGIMSALRALDPQPFEWDVQVIPSHPEGRFTGMGTYGYAVSVNAQNTEVAWQFVKHLLSAEAQIAIAQNYAGTPLLRSLREDPALVDLPAPPENITAFIENGENGILPTYFPGDCGSLYAGQISQEIKAALESAILGMMSVEEAFTIANDNIQSCLDG
jgi:multiple sugar transport system substrate-binding protein